MKTGKAGRRLVLALSGLGAVLALVTLLPPRWYVRWLSGQWNEPRAGVLIVLGGDAVDTGMVGLTSYWRSSYAVLAWKGGAFRRMILSGATPITLPMRDFVVCQGVPADAVTIEGQSTSTHENAVFAARLARQFPGPYVLLTSDYHMHRALAAFRKAGLDVTPLPFPDALKRMTDWRDRWRVFLDLVQESGKTVYYWGRGWI